MNNRAYHDSKVYCKTKPSYSSFKNESSFQSRFSNCYVRVPIPDVDKDSREIINILMCVVEVDDELYKLENAKWNHQRKVFSKSVFPLQCRSY